MVRIGGWRGVFTAPPYRGTRTERSDRFIPCAERWRRVGPVGVVHVGFAFTGASLARHNGRISRKNGPTDRFEPGPSASQGVRRSEHCSPPRTGSIPVFKPGERGREDPFFGVKIRTRAVLRSVG